MDETRRPTSRAALLRSPFLHAPTVTPSDAGPAGLCDTPTLPPDPTLDALLTPFETAPTPPAVPRHRIRRIAAGLRPDGPATLHRVRFVVGAVLIGVFVVASSYIVWDSQATTMIAARHQDELETLYEQRLTGPAATPPQVTTPASEAPAAPTDPASPAPERVTTVPRPVVPLGTIGDVAGRLVIPAAGVDQIVVYGTDKGSLRKGPGVWMDGVAPGMPGNATIAGHRTTYGAPFRHLDDLRSGDRIVFQLPGQPDAVFEVRGSAVVPPSQVTVTAQGAGVRLTLTTCEPVGSDAKRLVVQAELVEGVWADQAVPAPSWKIRL